MKDNNKLIFTNFSSIEKEIVSAIDRGIEKKENTGTKFVIYGEKNRYKEYLYDLFADNANLQSIIQGTTSFCTAQVESPVKFNEYDENADVMAKLIADYLLFGEAYILVCKDSNYNVKQIYWVDAQYIRVDKDEQAYFYSEDWNNKSVGRVKTIVYPKYIKGGKDFKSIYSIKTPQSRGVYGTPLWKSAVKSVVIENKIDEFHLNNISNGFFPSAIINLNNGVPQDEIKAQIETDFMEKFCGAENAGRFVLSFNDSLQNKTTIEKIETNDFADRYNALATTARQKIYTAFGATPNLFGLPTETTGFNTQEFSEAFKLYNASMVMPIQNRMKRVLETIYEREDIVTFGIYSIDSEEEEIIIDDKQ